MINVIAAIKITTKIIISRQMKAAKKLKLKDV